MEVLHSFCIIGNSSEFPIIQKCSAKGAYKREKEFCRKKRPRLAQEWDKAQSFLYMDFSLWKIIALRVDSSEQNRPVNIWKNVIFYFSLDYKKKKIYTKLSIYI